MSVPRSICLKKKKIPFARCFEKYYYNKKILLYRVKIDRYLEGGERKVEVRICFLFYLFSRVRFHRGRETIGQH